MWSLVTFFLGVVILLPSSCEGTQPEHVAKNCKDLQYRGNNETGIYLIKPESSPLPFLVYCDMDTEGGGWAVFLNREDDRQSFALPWNDYKYGFGNDSSFWLGLEYLYHLTTDEPNELLMKSTDYEGETYYAHYDSFRIGSEGEDYRLKLLDRSHGNLTDAFSYSSGQKFSTIDRNNEVGDDEDFCINMTGGGGWWYNKCYLVVFTGHDENTEYRSMILIEYHIDRYYRDDAFDTYTKYTQEEILMNTAKMMVRPKKKYEKNLQEDNTDKENEENDTVKDDPEKGYFEKKIPK